MFIFDISITTKHNKMTLYKIVDREAGNIIETNLTLEEAKQYIRVYEMVDIDNDEYVPDFYQIKEMED